MTRLLKEPLLHFLLLGGALFVLSGFLDRDGKVRNEGDQIVVSEARIEQLQSIFAKTWQRPPTRRELEGLVDDFVLEEIYYRQALEMGTIGGAAVLGRDDVGSLEAGKAADFAIWEIERPAELAYRIGFNPLAGVVKAGRLL